MDNLKERARQLRIRAYAMGVEVRQIAEAIGNARPYLSNVLRGHYESEAVCDKVEKYLDQLAEEEDEQYQLAA